MQSHSADPIALAQAHLQCAPIPIPGFLAEGLLKKADEAQANNRQDEAERLLRLAVELEAKNATALERLGLLLVAQERQSEALPLLIAALKAEPMAAGRYSNLGTVLQSIGRLHEAAQCYEQALKLNPEQTEAMLNLGSLKEAEGDHKAAEALLRKAVALCPSQPEAWVNLGNVLQSTGSFAEAVECSDHALALRSEFPEAHFNRANAMHSMGRFAEAELEYRTAIAERSTLVQAYGNLGNLLQAEERFDEAERSYNTALELRPDYAEGWYNLGNLRQAESAQTEAAANAKLHSAIDCYRHAIALQPNLAEAHYNLGNTYEMLDQLPQAEDAFRRAIALRANYAQAHYNLGCTLEKQARLPEAIAAMEQAICLDPEYHQARFALALVHLRSADFATGWQLYESRWNSPDHRSEWRDYPIPQWRGEPLNGGALLLWAEQGIGDEIQFASILSDALRYADGPIAIDCEPRLRPLFARSWPQLQFVDASLSHAEVAARFAAHLPIASLPGLFRNSVESFAHSTSPYLFAAHPQPTALLQDRPLRIGISWKTTNRASGHRRNLPLELLRDLTHHTNSEWISLQYGDHATLANEISSAGAAIEVDTAVDSLHSLDDFATQIAALDLVITIDNSTAHMAGALGKKTWLLLPQQCDWRWMTIGTTTLWYPTLELFRQSISGDWSAPLGEVANRLATINSRNNEVRA